VGNRFAIHKKGNTNSLTEDFMTSSTTQRFALAIGLAILLAAAAASAQDKAEVFGGFQYFRPDGGPNMNGWNGAVTGNINKYFGITGDFSGTYGSGLSFYTYTFGPKLTANLGAAKPFVHVLVGGARISGGGGSDTGFDTMVGGGLDVGHGHLAFRVIQADWMLTRFSLFTNTRNFRASTGLVLRF
jgi:hypothetical protein